MRRWWHRHEPRQPDGNGHVAQQRLDEAQRKLDEYTTELRPRFDRLTEAVRREVRPRGR